jgi:methylmalonic aciduria homocystinuria type C protein
MGVCLHPKYGGWFAMRCAFIFKNLVLDDNQLAQNLVEDPLKENVDSIVDVIKKFNYNWKDSTYRDVINVEERYSEMQKEYFLTDPKLRKDLLKEWLSYPSIEKLHQSYYSKKYDLYLDKNFYII